MPVKDFNESENRDQDAKKIPAVKPVEDEPATPDQSGHTEVKNAHASGDGSFGRSESSLPDEEATKERGSSTY